MSKSILGLLRRWYRAVLLKDRFEYLNRVKILCQQWVAENRHRKASAVKQYVGYNSLEMLEQRTMLSAVLGYVDPDGVLLLNMGPRAADRIEGNIEDGAETFTISQDGDDILLSFEDTEDQRYSGVTSIYGQGGLDDDRFYIDGEVTVPVRFYGDTGDDTIMGGNADDTLSGGDGDDVLYGGLGNDTLYGNAGSDQYIFEYDWGADVVHDSVVDDDMNSLDFTYASGSTTSTIADGNLDVNNVTETGVNTVATGATEINVITGGSGNDSLVIGSGENWNGTFDGGDGINSLDFSAWTTGIQADLAAGQATGINEGATSSFTNVNAIYGGSGNDVLFGSTGSEAFYPMGGDDVVYGLGGYDAFYVGVGVDTIWGGSGNDYYNILFATELRTTQDMNVYGQEGTILPDDAPIDPPVQNEYFSKLQINDPGGSDTLDFALNTAGINVNLNNRLWQRPSGASNQHLLQLNGAFETVIGSDYNDTIHMTSNGVDWWVNPTAQGGAGNDTIIGSDLDDKLYGEDGDDVIRGGKGNDMLFDGDGNDIVDGQKDNDTIYAGYGQDHYYGSEYDLLTYEEFDGGYGMDIDMRRGTASTIIPVGAPEDTPISDDRIHGLVNVVGTQYDDIIQASPGNGASVNGMDGDDTLYGSVGKGATFYITAGQGKDTVTGTQKYDNVVITISNDTGVTQVDLTDIATGNDGITDGVNVAMSVITSEGTEVTDIADIFGIPAVTLDMTGSSTNNTVNAYGIDERRIKNLYVYFGSGADHFNGTDTDGTTSTMFFNVFGGAGNDYIIGGDRNDVLSGEEGTDTVSYEYAPGRIVGKFDKMRDGMHGRDMLSSFEVLKGTQFNDVIQGDDSANTIYGLGGNDSIKGKKGNDTIYGGDGNDVIRGDHDNDLLFGEAGDDKLLAGAGNDELDGGAGDDKLYGRSGTNSFVYETGADRIYAGKNDWLDMSEAPSAVDANLGERRVTVAGEDKYVAGLLNIIGSVYDDTLVGDRKSNSFLGMAGDDTIDGVMGHNTIAGGEGDDTITADRGNDTLMWAIGDGTNDTFDLGAGKNTLIISGDGSDDQLQVGDGANQAFFVDQITFQLGQFSYLTFNGNAGSDTLIVGPDAVLLGITGNMGSGDDILNAGNALMGVVGYGENGNDVFFSGAGRNVFDGGDGDDTIDYDYSPDGIRGSIEGTMRNGFPRSLDKLSGMEILRGSEHNDVITGGKIDSNTIYGEGGNDTITARYGDNTLYGGDGDDILKSGGTLTEMHGGAGDDMLYGRANNAAYFATYTDSDSAVTVTYPTANGQVVNENDNIGTDTLVGVYAVTGSAYDDNMTAGTAGQLFNGGAGNDELNGGDGNDLLDGGAGDDTLNGGGGNDVLYWGTGYGSDTLDGGGGNNTVEYGNYLGSGMDVDITGSAAGFDCVFDIEDSPTMTTSNIQTYNYTGGSLGDAIAGNAGEEAPAAVFTFNLGSGNDTFIFDNTALQQITVYGGAGDDTITTTDGDDKLYGGAGNDTLDSGIGNDLLVGDSGNDTYILGTDKGRDTIHETSPQGDWLDFSGSTQAITARTAGSYTYNANGDSVSIKGEVPNILGSDFDDTLTGSNSSNAIIGNEGDDTIDGKGGDDLLHGGNAAYTGGVIEFDAGSNDGQDTIYGGSGDDMIVGGSDDDVLYGEAGNDTMIGGWLDGDTSSYDVFTENASTDGDDYLDGGTDTDSVIGSGGDDTFFSNSGDDAIWGGYVTFQNSYTYPTRIELPGLADGLDSFEILGNGSAMVWGGSEDDGFDVNNSNALIFGGIGDDVINGKAGMIAGGYGDDIVLLTAAGNVFAGFGIDTVIGSQYNDYIDIGLGSNIYTYLSGRDFLRLGDETNTIITDEALFIDLTDLNLEVFSQRV